VRAVRFFLHTLFVLGLFVVAPAQAQQPAVGRVSLVDGRAAYRATGDPALSKAEVNAPVAAGTSLRTDPHARAEIRIGSGEIQISSDTDLEIVRLDDRFLEIVLRQGRIGLRLRRLDDGEAVQIDLPDGGLWPGQPGAYDIETGHPARITAFDGSARFAGGGADIAVGTGEQAVLANPAVVGPAGLDDFGEWCRSRDYDETALAAPYFISPSMTGYEALDANGRWEGAVWYPRGLAPDWAPYHFGHWRWIAPWGWSWIDEAEWGFATSHYGRWAYVNERWGWVPGSYVAHPLFAPALVAFLGTPGIGLSVAEGNGPAVAWFPLAPGEIYWPSYTADLGYVRQLNLANVPNVEAIRLGARGELPLEVFNERFANREFASAVRRTVFAAGGAVAPALLHLPEQRLVEAPVIMGSPQVTAAAPKPVAAPRIAVAAAPPRSVVQPVQQITILRPAKVNPPGRAPRVVLVHAVGSHLRAPAFIRSGAPARGQTAPVQPGHSREMAARLAHAAHAPRR